ncbi:DUF2141 domain-containing protein [Mesoflavibacter profundi]|uniref:DUF2141 domain-containing protein n=1 Tax=Mesoflavibacter profundi TaxID=2708110 RepID=A0ABT4RZX3_9FLAO|nr:DUF2141 domain-containing protein [Mesoflavibacter profundi]MDA0177055.1 DUF2141 domain-containing protein [Mesoflavibacter profundi]
MKTVYFTLKNCSLSILFTLVSLVAVAQSSTQKTTNTITVTVDNLKNNNGHVMFGLHTNSTWLKGPGLKNEMTTIVNGKATITFKDVNPGTYAILVLHDQNDNKQMDFDNGMPIEDYGMSNNPMSFGPPIYNEAKFTVTDKDIELNIRL